MKYAVIYGEIIRLWPTLVVMKVEGKIDVEWFAYQYRNGGMI